MTNPWPIAVRLLIGLGVLVVCVLALNRYADRERPPPQDVRVEVFNDVFEDLAAGNVRLKRWRQTSGLRTFPGIGERECGELRAAAALDPPVNEQPAAATLRSAAASESLLTYVRLYNETLRDLLRSRYGECAPPPGSGDGGV